MVEWCTVRITGSLSSVSPGNGVNETGEGSLCVHPEFSSQGPGFPTHSKVYTTLEQVVGVAINGRPGRECQCE
eukprot:1188766-Prorocentrum_minimum.AAC.4